MIFQETFDYLYGQLAGAQDFNAIRRQKDYQRKRLRRAQIAMSVRPYFLQASWVNPTGAAGEEVTASTQASDKPLYVLDGAIRFGAADNVVSDGNNFELWIRRTAGDSRVQPTRLYIKDELILTPAQAAIKPIAAAGGGQTAARGQGAPWPYTWPVPIHLAPNELLQVKSRVLTGGVTANRTTFTQFRCAYIDSNIENDTLLADIRNYIAANPVQRAVYLSMFTTNQPAAVSGFKSIVFPATGANQRTTGQTREAMDHLLVLGYSMLNARSFSSGTLCSPQWRVTTSDGYSLSKEEIDCNCFGYAGPGFFYQAFPQPLLLPKGSSLSASFSTVNAIANEVERRQNYVFFRCVTV